jgi:hypothetical protein
MILLYRITELGVVSALAYAFAYCRWRALFRFCPPRRYDRDPARAEPQPIVDAIIKVDLVDIAPEAHIMLVERCSERNES